MVAHLAKDGEVADRLPLRDLEHDVARLELVAVERLAQRTGGVFQKARDAGAVQAVYERIDQLEKAVIEEPRYVFLDRYLRFLMVALGCLLGGLFLSSTWLGVLP